MFISESAAPSDKTVKAERAEGRHENETIVMGERDGTGWDEMGSDGMELHGVGRWDGIMGWEGEGAGLKATSAREHASTTRNRHKNVPFRKSTPRTTPNCEITPRAFTEPSSNNHICTKKKTSVLLAAPLLPVVF